MAHAMLLESRELFEKDKVAAAASQPLPHKEEEDIQSNN